MIHSEVDIDHLAKLARIEFDEREREIFSNQLQNIVGYCSKVCEADVENLEPMVHSFSHEDNFWAEDVPEHCEDGVDFLSPNAPEMKEGQIVVPRVL
ncbi:MAG: Asp-tRNA(Asn)/Glu-tRNA(Gln) amidotransferase subunit GatC [Puniceicoccales bacterium]|jgi:aspartyl-tRNA(Asn)/glutamyl-tRNA(Gln) amidotransferase subunit C|nr:Asp-tRNA(Asn)/Glu-tRNA(Gln) amidotransferase subunit GatC [Puniceicoccales bacterium]